MVGEHIQSTNLDSGSDVVDIDAKRANSKEKRRQMGRQAMSIGAIALGSVVGAGLGMKLSPYTANVNGIKVTTEVVLRPKVTIESSLGSIDFDRPSALPLGFEVTPTIMSIGSLTDALDDTTNYIKTLEQEVRDTLPDAGKHFAMRGGIGLLAGATSAMLICEQFSGAHQQKRRRIRSIAAGATTALTLTGTVGMTTYNHDWQNTLHMSGALTELLETPDQLEKLSQMDIAIGQKQLAALEALRDVVASSPEEGEMNQPSLTILLISDMHLRNMYPQLQQYIEQYNVDLIINAGDETLYGSKAELFVAPSYVESIKEITKKTPMFWVEGNHDSSATAAEMSNIPGVTVLDEEIIKVFGLTIAGLGDPRDFSDGGDTTSSQVAQVERDYASEVVPLINQDNSVDIFVTHHPAAAEQATKKLDKKPMVTISGHFHNQSVKQTDQTLDINVGSTGLGGLENLESAAGNEDTTMQFSILQLSDDCQPTTLTQFSLSDPTLRPDGPTSITRTYISPEKDTIAQDRTCSPELGIDDKKDWSEK